MTHLRALVMPGLDQGKPGHDGCYISPSLWGTQIHTRRANHQFPVQPPRQKYSASCFAKITFIAVSSRP